MPVQVSVIVAVYNPGPHIEGLLRSFERQTLPVDQFETILVDDGSTDGTGEMLHELASTRPNMVVKTIPNSGWPGRPRNIGLDLARGTYVFYCDNDDELFPESLERMVAMAERNGSDIVYGKVVRGGRHTPYWSLAHRTIDAADVVEDNLLSSRAIHKLFRRQFLLDHDIRYPEGKVRLEDHNFMAQAVPRARTISVLADYPCYKWNHRNDGSNNSAKAVDYDAYWRYFAESMELFEKAAGPGALNDAEIVSAAERTFLAVRPRHYLRRDEAQRERVFRPLHRLIAQYVPERLEPQVGVAKRLRVRALRLGDRAAFDLLQEQRHRISARFELEDVSWQGPSVRVAVEARLGGLGGLPFELEESGEDLLFPVPDALREMIPTPLRLVGPQDRGSLEVTVRHRGSDVEWPVRGTSELFLDRGKGGVSLRVRCEAVIDPVHGYFGDPLESGVWDVLVRAQFLGESTIRRLPVTAADRIPEEPHPVGDRMGLLYPVTGSTLALTLAPGAGDTAATGVRSVRWEGQRLRLQLNLPEDHDAMWLTVRKRGERTAQEAAIDSAGVALVELGPTQQGEIFDFFLNSQSPDATTESQRLAFGAPELSQRPPYRIYATAQGFLSVKHEAALARAAGTSPRDRALRVAGRVLRKLGRG
jgi:glycosyltransferase involved in cell wall biosynthesis